MTDLKLPTVAEIRLREGDEIVPFRVPCERIDEWLVIVPSFSRDTEGNTTLSGRFSITHLPSGWDLGGGSGCVSCCRRAGREIAALGLDWSVVTSNEAREWAEALPAETRKALHRARALDQRCDAWDCGADDPEGDDR